MNDFLQSLREKRFDKDRRPYSNPQYRNQENRGGTESRKPPFVRFVTVEQFQAVIGESLPFLKSLLETISEGQKRQADASERIARAEELKAESLKKIADYLSRGAKLEVPAESAEIAQISDEAETEAPVPADRGGESKSTLDAQFRKPIQGEATRRGAGVTEKVQKAIEKHPGIDFKTLVKKTGLATKQVQNALPPLKKAGKIRSEGKGIYSPIL